MAGDFREAMILRPASAGSPLFESGVAAKLLGTVRSVIFGGIVTLGVVGVTAWKIPPLRRLDQLE